jgi:predicted O-methyltransferase YrrM
MPKLKTLWRLLQTLSREPRRITRVLDDEADHQNYVIRRYGLRTGLPTVDWMDLFPEFEETVDPYSFLDGGSLPTDLALLKGLARKKKVRTYYEIGTWRGESASNVASIAEECISVSLSDEEMRQYGLSEQFIKVHGFFSCKIKNVKHIRENSRSLDYSQYAGRCDLVFIDADHTYESVLADTRNAFPLMRNIHSIIVWHDYGFSPETVRWSVLAGILDGSPSWTRDHLYHVSNTKCAVYIQEQINTRAVEYPAVPNKAFAVKLTATKV